MDKLYNKYLNKILKSNLIEPKELLKLVDDYINSEKENFKCYNLKILKYKEETINLKIIYKVLDEEAFKYSSKMISNKLYGNYKAEVKTRLMMMFIKGINEVICMIENGFCSCALSRIRYMYEIAVFINIIENNDEKLAEKFFRYSEKSRLKIAKYLKRFDIEKEIYNRFDKNGINLSGDYNWARNIVKKNKGKIFFRDLVKISRLEDHYIIYIQCCLYTHADIFGSMFSIDKYEFEKYNTWITTPSKQGTETIYTYLKVLIMSVIVDYFELSKENLFVIMLISRILKFDILNNK